VDISHSSIVTAFRLDENSQASTGGVCADAAIGLGQRGHAPCRARCRGARRLAALGLVLGNVQVLTRKVPSRAVVRAVLLPTGDGRPGCSRGGVTRSVTTSLLHEYCDVHLAAVLSLCTCNCVPRTWMKSGHLLPSSLQHGRSSMKRHALFRGAAHVAFEHIVTGEQVRSQPIVLPSAPATLLHPISPLSFSPALLLSCSPALLLFSSSALVLFRSRPLLLSSPPLRQPFPSPTARGFQD